MQGMSDLATPILYVMRDEATAFWCFAHLMERMEANFSVDCTGMHTQLAALDSLLALVDPELHAALKAKDCTNFFFCYRWLLVHFKREFSFDEVRRTVCSVCDSECVRLTLYYPQCAPPC